MKTSDYTFADLTLTLLLSLGLLLASLILPNAVTAGSNLSASSSFKNPKGCKNARALAQALKAIRACEQRFSPTHEFAILLFEKRYLSNANSDAAKAKSVRNMVRKYTSDLRTANSKAPGQKFEMFESSESLPNAKLSGGAEFCMLSNGMIVDRRVPKYVGEEFRIWIETRVCGRFDDTTNTIQLVELRATERFRVSTDGALAVERFKYLMPSVSAGGAYETLRLY